MRIPPPPKQQDDIAKLRNSITHKVHAGDFVHVSVGGMRQAVVRCIARGADGITVEDEAGEKFGLLWEHVIGLAGKEKKHDGEPMTKAAVLFVKADHGDIDAMLASDKAAGDIVDAAPPRYSILDDRIELPPRNVIDTPDDFAGNFDMETRWNVALHEAGHCVAALLIGGCAGAGVERLSGHWHGIAYDEVSEGGSRYGIALAGCAAECLGPWPGGFFFDQPDFKEARDETRAQGIPEIDIIPGIAADLAAMVDEFEERWTKGIRELAHAICRQGWVNEDQVRKILGTAQARLTKSTFTSKRKWEDFRPIIGTALAKSTPLDCLEAELGHIQAQTDLDATAGKSAHEVTVAVVRRNQADIALANTRGRA